MHAAITTLNTVIICFAIVMRRHRPGQSRYPYVVTAALAMLLAISQVLRGGYFAVAAGSAGAQIYLTTFNFSLLCVGATIMTVMSMCAILIAHDSMQPTARGVPGSLDALVRCDCLRHTARRW